MRDATDSIQLVTSWTLEDCECGCFSDTLYLIYAPRQIAMAPSTPSPTRKVRSGGAIICGPVHQSAWVSANKLFIAFGLFAAVVLFGRHVLVNHVRRLSLVAIPMPASLRRVPRYCQRIKVCFLKCPGASLPITAYSDPLRRTGTLRSLASRRAGQAQRAARLPL